MEKKRYFKYDIPRNCLLCDKKQITTCCYHHNKIMWEDGFIHYMDAHNITPSIQFREFILRGNVKQTGIFEDTKPVIRLSRVVKDKKDYVIVDRNQLLILDALMIHGGYAKKYIDLKTNFKRYSEHAGFLDFEDDILSKIVVSGRTNRVDEGDDEIYLPVGMDDMFDYEYIFHTHPPTPKPGGRAIDGILYELPSIGDIYHFIDHHNEGNVIGSLIVSAEGLYNIRKTSDNPENIDINDNDLYRKYQRIFNKVQHDALLLYGDDFDTKTFYTEIAQNTSHIVKINHVLNTFNIHLDYYPRKKDEDGHWIIDTVFLVFRKNKSRK